MTALQKAYLYWLGGQPIPLDLAIELMNEGYDVEALEAEHLS